MSKLTKTLLAFGISIVAANAESGNSELGEGIQEGFPSKLVPVQPQKAVGEEYEILGESDGPESRVNASCTIINAVCR